ncbi:MAG: CapA family protein [Mesorhizobium sp.]|uniref:CapA family protein n=1 Tax=Mesorhizobium sp. TaxID=1871066 RepID=UPI000FE82726|nr:CapA family protein [Mesorhizobium sp.]RWD40475.1 MAG: CapA family protein [Mesorhizobium sp.]RWE51311.1 MAG: CapA family protein [Mesorhizobium sp.]RWF06594.1 MAG: CapA family protein [Mesorhizobium sp.]RWF14834.1 MAG: CapA family protein [Mesorhizobium sp.]TIY06779.1 MAG: CapA family protein [Mesorhizobium sp.]
MPKNFTLAVTGQSLIHHDIRANSSREFQDVNVLLREADLAFTNFEGTIAGSHRGWPLKGSAFGSSQPYVLDALQEIGFQALSLSNNHSFDLGPSGVLSTLEEVEKRGFLHGGIGRNMAEASTPSSATFSERSVSIIAMDGGPGPNFMYAEDGGDDRPERPGINPLRLSRILEVDDETFEQLRAIRDKIGYSAVDWIIDYQPDDKPSIDEDRELALGRAIYSRSQTCGRSVRIDEADLTRNLQSIAVAAQSGRLVIAYLHHHHWASDWLQPPDWIGDIARKCIDAGAAIFVSHGAPVLQPVEIYQGRPIFYSLGNFIFHTVADSPLWQQPEVWESVVGVCSFDEGNHLTGLRLYPVLIGGEEGLRDDRIERRLVPHLATGSTAERILRRVADRSQKFGSHIEITNGVGVLRLA